MKVSVVIPAYNAEKTIASAVGAALAQDVEGLEVVVVDDGSTDSTPDIVKPLPVKYIRQDNAGPACARNTGWKGAGGEIVVFVDSDCVPAEGWLRKLLDGFTGSEVGAVTGSYDIANPGRLLPRFIHEEIKERHAGYGKRVRFFGSYNVALRREALVATGGFDEGYRRASGEDNDLSYRVIKAGYEIAFAPDALVAHHHTVSLMKYLREQYTHGFWRMKLYRDHPDMASGDDYTRLKDVIEPPLGLISLASVPVMPVLPSAVLFLFGAMLLIQVPYAVRVALRLSDPVYLLMCPVTFLRGYARGLGMLAGLVRFTAGGAG